VALYLGLISGTSMDAIDVALVDIDDDLERGPIALREFFETPYPPELRARLESVVQSRAAAIDEIGRLHTALGQAFAAAALSLLAQAGVEPSAVRAVGSHGQTIGHGISGATPYTWQLGDPHVIALRTGIPTVADFRAMDVAAGGQGAPLVPAFHRRLFRNDAAEVAVVNIGGISNVSLLRRQPQLPLLGFDCGPGNTLMDLWMQRHQGQACDLDGRWAATGRVQRGLLRQMLSDPYFALSPPKSTGRELFHLAWLERQLAAFGQSPSPADVQATLAQLTVSGIVEAIARHLPACRDIVVCGGGAHNGTLLRLLAEAAGETRRVTTSDALGWPTGAIEACTFAWLAARRLAGLAGNVPTVTGARAPVLLGALYEAGKF